MSETADASNRRPGRAARILRASALPLVAGVLVLTGAVLAATGTTESFGWFSYAPLQEGTRATGMGPGSLLVLTGRMQLGYLLIGTGLVAAAFWGGFRLGRRPGSARSTRRQDPAPQD